MHVDREVHELDGVEIHERKFCCAGQLGRGCGGSGGAMAWVAVEPGSRAGLLVQAKNRAQNSAGVSGTAEQRNAIWPFGGCRFLGGCPGRAM